MIEIKMNNNKWRLGVHNEEWEFVDKHEMKEVLDALVNIKEKYGRLGVKFIKELSELPECPDCNDDMYNNSTHPKLSELPECNEFVI